MAISTKVLVVPDMADNTTIFGVLFTTKLVKAFIRSAEPTDVPPNFTTNMVIFLLIFFANVIKQI
ncbi:MAG: hypothetical protein KFKLKKLM_00578 [Flavobacteriales bacterium]|nr:hypothetical protein [Flavobacteriales bacterium]